MRCKSPPIEAAETQEDRLRRSALVGELAAGVLHDFNNILTVISGTIEILAEAVADRPDLAAVANLIDEAAARGARMASHLLAFARGRPSQLCRVDVNALLDEATRLLRPALGGEIEMVRVAAPDAAPALADPGQLMAAVLGLAMMARNAMAEGGKLTFEITNARSRASVSAAPGEAIAADDDVVIALKASCRETAGAVVDRIFADLAAVEDFVRRSGCSIRTGRHEVGCGLVEIHVPKAAPRAR
jgi:signal transduction histidine kinase